MELEVLAREYLTDATERVGWAARTIQAYGIHLHGLFAWLEKRADHVPVATDYTADALQTYDTSRKRAGKAQRTRAAGLACYQSFARYLAAHGYIDGLALAGITTLKVRISEKAKKKWASPEQVAALFEGCSRVPDCHGLLLSYRGPLCTAVLAVLAYGGLRRSEVCNLALSDIELDAAVPLLTVRQGKGDKSRSVWLHPEAVKHLRAWIAVRPDSEWLFAVPVWTSVEAAPMTTGRLTGILRELLRLARIADKGLLAMHAFRRFAATNLLKIPGCTIAHVSEFLGHGSIAITLEYIGTDTQELQRLVMQMKVETPKPPVLKLVEDQPVPVRRRAAFRRTG